MPSAAAETTETAPLDPPQTPAPAETLPPDTPRNKGGRPRRGQTAQELAEAPPAASRQAESKEFWSYQRSLDTAEWQSHIMYLYRWKPYYDKTKGGTEPKYVCLYNSATSEEEIKSQHGSGVYNLKLNRYNAANRQDTTIKQVVFTILDPRFPPNLPDGDWQIDPRNKDWVWKKDAAPAPAGVSGDAAMFREMKDFMRDMVRQMVPEREQDRVTAELVKVLPQLMEARKETTNHGPTMIEIITLIKTLMPAPAPAATGPDPLLMRMMDAADKRAEAAERRAADSHAQMMTLLTADRADRKGPDMLTQVRTLGETVAAFSTAAESMGGGRGGGTSWASAAENIGVELAKGLAPILPRMFAPQPQPARPQPQPQPRQQQQQAPPPTIAGSPTQQQPGATPQPAAPPAAEAIIETAPAPTEIEPVNDDMKQILIQSLNVIAGPLLSYVNGGQTGIDFAWWIFDGYGAGPLNMLRGQSRQALCELIRVEMSPLYQQLQPNWAQFETFVDELLSWNPTMIRGTEDDEEEEEDAMQRTRLSPDQPIDPSGAASASGIPDRAKPMKKAAPTKGKKK